MACGGPSVTLWLSPSTWGQLSLPRGSLPPVQGSLCHGKPLQGHSEEHTVGKAEPELLPDPWVPFWAAQPWLGSCSRPRLGIQNPSGVFVLRKRAQQFCPRPCLTTRGPVRDVFSSLTGEESYLGIPWLAGGTQGIKCQLPATVQALQAATLPF